MLLSFFSEVCQAIDKNPRELKTEHETDSVKPHIQLKQKFGAVEMKRNLPKRE